MILSGWLSVLAPNNNLQYVDLFLDTTRADGSGTDVYASIALSLYQQGEGGSGLGDAACYIRGYGTKSGTVDVPGDAANNGYYCYESTFVQFRLIATFAYAYANAATFPLSGASIGPRLVNRDFTLSGPDGRHLSHVRFGLREKDSRLDVPAILDRSAQSAADHHRIDYQHVTRHEVANYNPPKPGRATMLP